MEFKFKTFEETFPNIRDATHMQVQMAQVAYNITLDMVKASLIQERCELHKRIEDRFQKSVQPSLRGVDLKQGDFVQMFDLICFTHDVQMQYRGCPNSQDGIPQRIDRRRKPPL